ERTRPRTPGLPARAVPPASSGGSHSSRSEAARRVRYVLGRSAAIVGGRWAAVLGTRRTPPPGWPPGRTARRAVPGHEVRRAWQPPLGSRPGSDAGRNGSGRAGWRGARAEVAEPLGQKPETPVQPPLHGLGGDPQQLRGLAVGESLDAHQVERLLLLLR